MIETIVKNGLAAPRPATMLENSSEAVQRTLSRDFCMFLLLAASSCLADTLKHRSASRVTSKDLYQSLTADIESNYVCISLNLAIQITIHSRALYFAPTRLVCGFYSAIRLFIAGDGSHSAECEVGISPLKRNGANKILWNFSPPHCHRAKSRIVHIWEMQINFSSPCRWSFSLTCTRALRSLPAALWRGENSLQLSAKLCSRSRALVHHFHLSDSDYWQSVLVERKYHGKRKQYPVIHCGGVFIERIQFP